MEATPEVALGVLSFAPMSLLLAPFGFALVLIAILVLLSRRKTGKRGQSVLLLGPSDSGKTAILSSLMYGETLSTHSSLQVNSSSVTLSEGQKPIPVVDVPGHPRLRDQFRDHLNDARVVAFVVDANYISRNGAMVAEHLHIVLHSLTSLPPSQKPPSLVILAHKSDLMRPPAGTSASSVSINRVRSILERELEKRRASHAGGVGVEGLGEEGETEMGGLECSNNEGGVFKFEDWEGGEVSFVGSYVQVGEKTSSEDEKGSQDGLQEFKEWLLENI